jgi:outer membrane protein assembly factor BamE (lipoprotein component of BamABCDE complex)
MNLLRCLVFALVLLTTSSCLLSRSAENTPLSREVLASLQPGTTTAREVVERLGAPVDVVQLGKRSAYRYQFTCGKSATILFLVTLSNTDVRSDRVWVFFDENQVLTHVGATLTGRDAEYAMPWEDLYD